MLAMLGLLAVAVALSAAPAHAQGFKLGDYTITGDMEGGVRQIEGERSSARYNEYRDIPQGLFFHNLELDIDKPGFYYELRAQDLLENDQQLRFSLGAPGLYRLDVEWHEIQHMFHNQAVTPYSGVGGNNLSISDTVQSYLQGLSGNTQINAVNDLFNSGHRERIGFDRDRAEVKFRYQLRPDWLVKMSYRNERWDGTRPIAMLFGNSPGGRPVIEVPMPVEYTLHDIRMALEWSRGGNSLELAYQASIFRNQNNGVLFDNPFRATNSAITPDNSHGTFNSTPFRGQFAEDPDNQAHYISLSGAWNLPNATRLMGTFSYGWMLQDESFVGHSVNDALYVPAGVNLTLPRKSLDGEINPTLVNLVLTNRAIQNLNITGRYRYHQLENNSKEIVFPFHTVGDIAVTQPGEPSITNHLMEFKRQNAGLDLSYRFSSAFKLNGGYEWRKNDYTNYAVHSDGHPEAKETQEDVWKVGADIRANKWLVLRPAYIHSDRDVSGYARFTYPSAADRRMYNLASRKRNEGKLMAMIVPNDRFSITVEAGIGDDDYDAKYGLKEGSVWNAAVELSFMPMERVTLFAGYAHEEIDGKIHSVQSTSSGTVFADVDAWTMKFTDTYDVVNAGIEIILLQDKEKNRKLTSRTQLSYSYSKGETDNSADFTGSAVSTANWPDIKAKLWAISTRLDYQLNKNFTVGVGYNFERYTLEDFTQGYADVVIPSTITTRAYTLGDKLKNYEAHTIAAFVRWRF